jgi:hypothetical protein
MNASTVASSTIQLQRTILGFPTGQVVQATVTYNAATRTATLDPTSNLQGNSTYRATVEGGSSGVKDVAGNALATDLTWSFRTQ